MNLKTIVVGTDFSSASLPAVETALALAQESQAEVILLHVVDWPVGFVPMAGIPMEAPMEGRIEEAERELNALIPANWTEGIQIRTQVLRGDPPKVISQVAEEVNADMIVVGTHGRKGLDRLLMGSTAEGLLRAAPCQVLVVKHKVETPAPA